MYDAEQKARYDKDIKDAQHQFSNQLLKEKQRIRMQEIFLQWKVTLDGIRDRRQNMIYSILQRQYKNKLYFALLEWQRKCIIQRKFIKIKKAASIKLWRSIAKHENAKRESLIRCIQLNIDLNMKYVITKWKKVCSASVKKKYEKEMDQQKFNYYKKLKVVCKLQTLETIRTTSNALITEYFKQWRVISKALQREILLKCIESQKMKLTKQALIKWNAKGENIDENEIFIYLEEASQSQKIIQSKLSMIQKIDKI